MPWFCEVFEKRLNVFTFPIKNVRFNNKRLFIDLKPTFRGNVSINYVNPSLSRFSARNSPKRLKNGFGPKTFLKRHKNIHNIKQCRVYRSGPYFAFLCSF